MSVIVNDSFLLADLYREEHERMTKMNPYWSLYSLNGAFMRIRALLQYLATKRQLRVHRYSGYVDPDGPASWGHYTRIFDANGDYVCDTHGYLVSEDVAIGGWDKRKVEKTEVVDANHIRIHLMISDNMPDLKEFKDPDGNDYEFEYNADDHFYGFDIVIHKDDVTDQFCPNRE